MLYLWLIIFLMVDDILIDSDVAMMTLWILRSVRPVYQMCS
jgi:hypothetical protein